MPLRILRSSVGSFIINRSTTPLPSFVTFNIDPYLNKVVFALNGNGSLTSSYDIIDSSSNSLTATHNTSRVYQGSFSPFNPTYASGKFGAGMLWTPRNANFKFAGKSTTVEFWVYIVNYASNNTLFNTYEPGVGAGGHVNYGLAALNVDTNGNLVVTRDFGYGAASSGSSANIPKQTWTHVAWTYDGTTNKIFVNGIDKTSTFTSIGYFTDQIHLYTTPYLIIGGGYNSGNSYFNNGTSYIADFRVVNSIVYTTEFTPPTSSLTAIANTQLLTLQQRGFVDNSSNKYSLTTTGTPAVELFSPFSDTNSYDPTLHVGSGYFTSSRYLSFPSITNITDFGSAAYTFECFVYTTSFAAAQVLFDSRSYLIGEGPHFSLLINTNGTLGLYSSGTARVTTTIAIPINSWNHIAVSRSSTSSNGAVIFINGIGQTFTDSTTYTGPANIIGAAGYTLGAAQFFGYISNLRIVKGSAVYTTNFTPPSSPVTNISGTSLLLNFNSGTIVDALGRNDLVCDANNTSVVIDSSIVKFGTGSIKFNGNTSEYRIIPSSSLFYLHGGDFTVEMWIYPTANTNTLPSLLEIGNHQNTDSILFLQQNGSNNNTPCIYSGGFYQPVNTPTLTLSSWNHLVYQRSSDNLKIFVNGVGSNALAFTNNITNTTNISIGYAKGYSSATTNYYYKGNIDDMRITRGVARYSGNFTPPTQENLLSVYAPLYFTTNLNSSLSGNFIIPQTLTVAAYSIDPNLQYRWYRSSTSDTSKATSISNATSSSYSTTTPGTYFASANSTVYGIISSNPLSLTFTGLLTTTPTITIQPNNGVTSSGTPATFTITASSLASISYQWFVDNTNVGSTSGAQTSAFTYASLISTNNIYCQVSNFNGYTQSNTVNYSFYPNYSLSVSAVLVGGGGGGGGFDYPYNFTQGGGGGGINAKSFTLPISTIRFNPTVVIGSGGSVFGAGDITTFNSSAISLTANGGQPGGRWAWGLAEAYVNGATGTISYYNNANYIIGPGGEYCQATGYPSQNNTGAGPGGSGATQLGQNANSDLSTYLSPGNGGTGLNLLVGINSTTYSGGGAGNYRNYFNLPLTNGLGGAGGGGSSTTTPNNGSVNTGGGGAGNCSGGSGTLLLMYEGADPAFRGGSVSNSGKYVIHTITSSLALSSL